LALLLGLGACGETRDARIASDSQLRAVVVEGVRLDLRGEPVLTLLERGGQLRRLTIWIGEDQAESIHVALSEIALPRPNTHDLLVGLLGGLERELSRVAITELRDGTYYAVIDVGGAGHPMQLDARPSDAVALAVRTGAPIFVDESVLAGGTPGGDTSGNLDAEWQPPAPAPVLPGGAAHQSRWRGGV
jgi:bifunctional DNase/RNase